MNDGSPGEASGCVLRERRGMGLFGDERVYDGMGGKMSTTQMFVGNVYTMRLKHMPADKWNARAEGRREQRTHQPTGGRGAQGGLRIGEMEREAILGHGASDFLRESFMKRADGYQTVVCNGCGTIPIYNEREGLYICPMCDGPVRYIGDNASNLEILPATKRSVVTFSRIEIPYAFKLMDQELNTYLNMGMRVLTDKDMKTFRQPPISDLSVEQERLLLDAPLKDRILPETTVPVYLPPVEEPEVRPEDLAALGAAEDKDAERPITAAAVVVAAPPTNQNGINLQLGNMNLGMVSGPMAIPMPSGPTNDSMNYPEDSMDDVPYGEGAFEMRQPLQQQQQQQQNRGVNVQSGSQPFLVVPLSMNQGPAPTEIVQSPVPGAPATIAVDTSETAMRSIGSNTNEGRSRSNSQSRRGNSPGASSAKTNSVVTVNRVGSNAPSQAPAGNVRVSVNKLG